MFELIDIDPATNVQEAEYARLLGYPVGHILEGRARELAEEARQWFRQNGQPWIFARQSSGLELNGEHFKLEGADFSSKALYRQFTAAGAHGAVLAAVSAGPECEERARQLWQEGKPDEYFFMEMYGSAVVEHLITATGGRVCAWAESLGMTVLPHYSPGYTDWDVSEQIPLWNVLRHAGADDARRPLEVLGTGMLRPKKSLLAVFGLTRQVELARGVQHLVPCKNCSLAGCQYRRKPYRHFLPQVEDVRLFQSNAPAETTEAEGSVLDLQARYTINPRALQKWEVERLSLKILHDDSIEARFRYEGTTCSNLGRPLEYDYHVKLAAPEEGYRIIDSVCVPAPGDEGHASQCEYLAHPATFTRSIASEKPLLGRPLNEVLTWSRAYSPSGCYCNADGRAHKWGLVLEVIHYALARREKELLHTNYENM